jgi:hypothetical protein
MGMMLESNAYMMSERDKQYIRVKGMMIEGKGWGVTGV